jgi:DNA-binding SARP family transcriptional activator/tetratricopeptide (TPR) repeat protein
MEFGLLGPLTVRSGGDIVAVPRGKQRAVLAGLLLKANQVVLIDELAEILWDTLPPPSAEMTIRNYVKRLRLVLNNKGGQRISTETGGYSIAVEAGELDVARFEELASSVQVAVRDGRWEQVSEQARAALSLWRGYPLADTGSHVLTEREAPRLAEIRLQLLEGRLDADMRSGGHADVIPELYRLVEAHPLREHLHSTLMLALYRCGRQADALTVYRDVRQILVAELGVEPGDELRRLHERMLAADPALTIEPARPVAGEAVPRELPGAVRHFVGRQSELAGLAEFAQRTGEEWPTTLVILTITGMAGVGKTELALQWAHQVADRFPDGQLYVNLRGYDPGEPMTAADALAGFLRALGVPGPDTPLETQARAARYRSLAAGKRMLVILDNALSAEQVRPLMPGTHGCAVVVTSRDSMAGLVARDGAQRLHLDALPPADAVSLLRMLIGDRVDADPAAAVRLAEQCARLPLALRVAAELAAARSMVSLADLAAELTDQRRRLDLLDAGTDESTTVRTVFSWSYRQLDAAAARAFRLAGVHPGPDFDGYAAAALTGATTEHTVPLLDRLVRAHLVHRTKPDRYALHDLLRAYASELADGHDGEQGTRAALTELLDYYLYTAATAMDNLYPAESHRRPRISARAARIPEVTSASLARDWLDAERANLVAVAAHVAERGWPGFTTRLSAILSRYFDVGGYYPEAVILHQKAISAARRTSDNGAEAASLSALGAIEYHQGRYHEAADHDQRALALYSQTSDRAGEGRTLGNLGLVRMQQGQYQEAAHHFEQALALHRSTADRPGEGRTLGNLGLVHLRQGRYQQAARHFEQALAVHHETGNKTGQAHALGNLGDIELKQGRPEQAARHFEQALAVYHEIGDPVIGGYALTSLGEVAQSQGQYRQAVANHRQALAIFRKTGERPGEATALNGLGGAYLAAGRPARARARYTAAQALTAQTGDKYQQARAHDGLARAYHADGDCTQARAHWEQALALYSDLGLKADKIRVQLQAADVPGGAAGQFRR